MTTTPTFDDIIKRVLANKQIKQVDPKLEAFEAHDEANNHQRQEITDQEFVAKVKKVKKQKEQKTSGLVGDFTDQDYPVELTPNNDPCQVCGKISKVGAHGIKDGKVYSEYYCFAHYNAKPGSTIIKEETEDDTEQTTSS